MASINSASTMVLIAVTLVWCLFASGVNGAIYNSLKVTWGMNVSNHNYFKVLPRLESQAIMRSWIQINNCTGKAAWRGTRYARVPDYSVVLLFDVNGYIAGIQMGIPSGLPNGFPGHEMRKYFHQDGDHYFSTVYFTDPEFICISGRSYREYNDLGTASRIVFQTGAHIGFNVRLPLYPNIATSYGFNQSACVPTMGRHHYFNLTVNTDCNNYIPLFLLANNQRINAFGWILTTQANSSRFEQPPISRVSAVISPVPQCLYTVGQITSMHVYLTANITANRC